MKKILISIVLVIGAINGLFIGMKPIMANAATAFMESKRTNNLPGSDMWTRGIKTPGNGWYLTYSYYHNASYGHISGAYTKQHGLKSSNFAGPGVTSTINAPSVPNYAGAYISAATQSLSNGRYKYVYDEGHGERLTKP